jgi:hypothetical protein
MIHTFNDVRLLITRGDNDYELIVDVMAEFNQGTEGTDADRRGWELVEYNITSSELSGEVILTNQESDTLLENATN